LKFRRVCSISASQSAFEICWSPTTATESFDTSCEPPLPQAAASRATAVHSAIRMTRCFMEKAPAAAVLLKLPGARRV
jgi:hypothetical protein